MVDVTIELTGDTVVRDELFDWLQRIPTVTELHPRTTQDTIQATLKTPAQLGTLAMAVATFLRTKPVAQRPSVSINAPNGESLDITASPDPHSIRRVFIAMDRQPPAAAPVTAIEPDIIDAEIVEDGGPHKPANPIDTP